MRVVWLVLALSLTGCKKKQQATPQEKPPPASPTRASRPQHRPTQKKTVGITPERRRTYWTHLREGRRLAREGRWVDAIASFEAAVRVIPSDGMALGELGWAAFHTGKYEKARAANARAALMAVEPGVKAAALYNLGRTVEAMGDREEAALCYSRSLHLRPSETVAKRLAKLGTRDPRPGIGLERPQAACGSAGDPRGLCPCLEKWARKKAEMVLDPDEVTCNPALKSADRVRVAKVAVGAGRHIETYFFVLARQADGWSVLGNLAYMLFYYFPYCYTIEELKLGTFKLDTLGGRRILRVETELTRDDGPDPKSGKEIDVRERTQTVCVVPKDVKQPVACPLHVPFHRHSHRRQLDSVSDEGTQNWVKGAEATWETRLDVKLAADGTVKITLAGGKKEPWVDAYLGAHKLF